MSRRNTAFIVLLFIHCFAFGQNILPVPELKSRVTDQTKTLTSAEVTTLENRLAEFEQSKGSQIVVLIVSTTGDETVEQYGIRVADQWKIGRENIDDGIILLVAMEDRKMRIEVGYGLEGAVPDALAKRIISQIITPEFRSGHYYDGINDGVESIIKLVNGEELPITKTEGGGSQRPVPKLGFIFIVLGFVLFAAINAFLKKKVGKVKGSLITSILLFGLLWFIINITVAIFATVILSAFFNIPGGGGRGGGRMGGGIFMGGGSFGGGGGFSGGGFSGGGGGFGGGGASGGW